MTHRMELLRALVALLIAIGLFLACTLGDGVRAGPQAPRCTAQQVTTWTAGPVSVVNGYAVRVYSAGGQVCVTVQPAGTPSRPGRPAGPPRR